MWRWAHDRTWTFLITYTPTLISLRLSVTCPGWRARRARRTSLFHANQKHNWALSTVNRCWKRRTRNRISPSEIWMDGPKASERARETNSGSARGSYYCGITPHSEDQTRTHGFRIHSKCAIVEVLQNSDVPALCGKEPNRRNTKSFRPSVDVEDVPQ